MKPVTFHRNGTVEGGTRLAIVFSGSPLFSGAAESGESNIRRWIIENDWLEAIVALPDQLFYNTSIYTYFWVVTNRKTPEREGKVALIDTRGAASKMKKSLGNKRHYLNEEAIAEITRLYTDAPHLADIDPRVKVFDNDTFGYQRITVEQPLRRKWVITEDTLTALKDTKAWAKEGQRDPSTIYVDLVGTEYKTEKDCAKALTTAGAPTSVIKELVKLAGTADPNAEILLDRKGQPLPDPDLRDYENVPLDHDPDEYLAAEIHPYAPEAWIDHTKTRIGYEIPLTRYFYVYTPPRPVSEIDKEITEREERIRELLGGLT
jgi:type I restriction enzyme M protein